MIKIEVIAPKKGVFEKRLYEAATRQLEKWLASKLKGLECPVHHERPTVTVVGTIKEPRYRIGACCQQFRDRVEETLRAD